jgi:hypothetical protein
VTFKIDAASDAGVCVIDSGGFVHFTGVGTCVVGADQAGDTTYSAAPHVTQTIAVAKRTQTIRVTSTPPTTPFVGDEYQITATGGGSLNPVTYSLDPASRPFACNVDDTGLVVFTGAGPCVIDLDQAGDARYLAAPQVSLSMTVGLHSQTIAFTSTPPAAPVVGDTYAVTATGGDSGHPVIFTIDPGSDPGVCSFDGSGLLHFFRAGNCVIGADQAGDDAYSAAPHVSQTVTVGKAPQILDITSTPPAHPVVGDTYQVTAAGGGSPLPLVVSIDPASDTDVCSVDVHGLVTFTSGGTCRIDVDQAGDRNYLPAAQVQQVVTVDRAAQAITVTSTAPPDPVVGGTYQVTATGGGSGQAVQVSIAPASDAGACTADASGLVTFTGAGTCVIDLFQPGDAAYQPAHLEVSLTVGALPTPTPQPTSSPGAPGAVQAEQSDGLPFTGTAAGPLLVVGSALCVAGLVLLLTGRRGRPRHRH